MAVQEGIKKILTIKAMIDQAKSEIKIMASDPKYQLTPEELEFFKKELLKEFKKYYMRPFPVLKEKKCLQSENK